jgi:2-oxoglutarate dehydrogenase E1 component
MPMDDLTSAFTGEYPAASEAREAGKKISNKASETGASLNEDQLKRAVLDGLRALMLIRAYRIRGHLAADLDPLGMREMIPAPNWILPAMASQRPIWTGQFFSITF